MNPAGDRRGLLLIGHGTQNRQGTAEFEQLARLVESALPHDEVQPAYLEFHEPTIRDGITRLLERGVTSITAVPVLLFSAGHAKRDIPDELKRAAVESGFGQIDQAAHLGCHPTLLRLSANRFREALGQPASGDTVGILVGRGSLDDSATAEMLRFVALREEEDPGIPLRVGFLAMAAPPLEEVAEQVSAMDCRQVVVQPHLLFHGKLLDRVQTLVEDMNRRQSKQHWIVAQHLQPVREVADVIVDRFRESPFASVETS